MAIATGDRAPEFDLEETHDKPRVRLSDYRGRANPHRLECAAILLDAGARLTERDEDYRSTPLAWAARYGMLDMVDLLLECGAPTSLSDDEPWATPLAWATKRGHATVIERLKQAGATA